MKFCSSRSVACVQFLVAIFLVAIFSTSVGAETPADKNDAKKDAKAADAAAAPTEAAPAGTVFSCESNIYYSWKRLPTKDEKGTKKGKEKPEVIQPDEAFFVKITETAPTMAEAEALVRKRFAVGQGDARRECERLHQNLSGCLVNTMRTSKEDYQVFDFELRRKYAAALQEDCVLNSGVCVSTRAAEIVCREEAIPAAVIATPPTEAAKAGDANKATPAKGAKKK